MSNAENSEMETELNEEVPPPTSGQVLVYGNQTRIMRPDGTALVVMDEMMRNQIAGRRMLSREEETLLIKQRAAVLDEKTGMMNDDGEMVDGPPDLENPEYVAKLRAEGLRPQRMIPANHPDAKPGEGILKDVGFQEERPEERMFLAYKGRFPPDRASFAMEWSMPYKDNEGNITPPAGVIRVAGAMQQFPVFLVRTPMWAVYLFLSGVPIHIVSVKLVAVAGLYLTTLVRGYGAPAEVDKEHFIETSSVRRPMGADLEASLGKMAELVEFMKSYDSAKTNDVVELTRSNLFGVVGLHLAWQFWNNLADVEEAFSRGPVRNTPRWFSDAWKRVTGRESPSVLPESFDDEMLQAPLVHVVMLHFHKKRAELEHYMFDRLEAGDMTAPFRTCSAVLRLYDDTIWDVLSSCRHVDFPQAHRAYSPYNYYRGAKGLEPDYDLKEVEGGMIDTRFDLADDGDWIHGEVAAEGARYVALMEQMTEPYETERSRAEPSEGSLYFPGNRAMVRHAEMVAAGGEGEENRALEIEEMLIARLPEVMREVMNQKTANEKPQKTPGNVVRLDPDPNRADEKRMRAVATKYDRDCAVCRKNMPVDYDAELGISFFVEATTRKDGRVVCIQCYSI